MAALRMPVLEIPIDDSAAQKFFASFQRYQDGLSKTPTQWKRTTEAIFGQREAFRQVASAGRPVETLWRNVAGWSGSVLSNTARITAHLLKWTTLLGGGLVGGSLFGITRMASDVAGYRRSAMGLGMSVGGMRSFGINMSRFVDPGSFLSSINAAISNPMLQSPLYALGVNPTGSTEQTSLSMLRAMRRLALSTPRGELGLMSQSYGLGPFGGLETLMRLRSTPASEFYRQLAAERRDRTGLGLPPGVAGKWQAFTTQMDRAGATIFKTFVVGLAPLEKPLQGLSVAFTGFLTRLMNGPLLKEGVNKLADFLNKFSVELTSKKFQSAVSNLVSDTGVIAQAFHAFAADIRGFQHHPVKSIAKGALDVVVKAPFKAGEAYGHWLLAGANMPLGLRDNNPGNLKYAGQAHAAKLLFSGGFATFRTPQDGLIALGRQLELYRDRGLDTVAGIIGRYAPPGDHNNTAAYVKAVAQRMRVGTNSELNLNDPTVLARLMSAIIRHENRNMQPYSHRMLGSAARTAIQDDTGGAVGVIVRNKVGASAVLAGAGLAAVPGT
jgi:hypothetical protein